MKTIARRRRYSFSDGGVCETGPSKLVRAGQVGEGNDWSFVGCMRRIISRAVESWELIDS